MTLTVSHLIHCFTYKDNPLIQTYTNQGFTIGPFVYFKAQLKGYIV